MRVSVCMATHNGAPYIEKQLRSILTQTRSPDEIVIVDDASSDDTLLIIRRLADARTRIFEQKERRGIAASFASAIAKSTGDVIFLADQDDLWRQEKIDTILPCLASDSSVVVHDAAVIGPDDDLIFPSLFAARASRPGIVRNVVSNSYTGCCMAFRKSVLPHAWPIPNVRGVGHDQWIGLTAELAGLSVVFLPQSLISFRRHGGNASSLTRRPWGTILLDRFGLLAAIVAHWFRRRAADGIRAPGPNSV